MPCALQLATGDDWGSSDYASLHSACFSAGGSSSDYDGRGISAGGGSDYASMHGLDASAGGGSDYASMHGLGISAGGTSDYASLHSMGVSDGGCGDPSSVHSACVSDRGCGDAADLDAESSSQLASSVLNLGSEGAAPTSGDRAVLAARKSEEDTAIFIDLTQGVSCAVSCRELHGRLLPICML